MIFLHPGSSDCVARNFGHDSIVCECNSTHCDSIGPGNLPPVGNFSSYLSSMAGSRLEASQGQIQVNSTGAGEAGEALWLRGKSFHTYVNLLLPGLRLTIVPHQKFQRIMGFGGAMTDAAAINILSLSAGAQEQLLRQYFSRDGTVWALLSESILFVVSAQEKYFFHRVSPRSHIWKNQTLWTAWMLIFNFRVFFMINFFMISEHKAATLISKFKVALQSSFDLF